jgi:hypothetical protein
MRKTIFIIGLLIAAMLMLSACKTQERTASPTNGDGDSDSTGPSETGVDKAGLDKLGQDIEGMEFDDLGGLSE